MKDPIDDTPLTNGDIIQERKKRMSSMKTALFAILSVMIALLLIQRLELRKTVEIIRQSNILLIILACFIYFSVNFFKTLRYRVLLTSYPVTMFQLFSISSFHNFFNQILPARTGELTFLYYAKKIGQIDIPKGLHTLLVTRIFDFIVISMIFISSLIFYYGLGASRLLMGIGIFFLIASIILLLNLRVFIAMLHHGSLFIAKKLNVQEKRITAKVLEKLSVLNEEFSGFNTFRYIPVLALTSILVWISLYSLFFVTIRAFGIPIDFIRSVIGSTGSVLTAVLPINSFGSFGTLEAGWAGGFILVGLSEQEAIVTGFGYHIIDFFSSTVLALFCFIFSKFHKHAA